MTDFMTTFLIIMSEAAGFFAVIIIVVLVFRIRSGITLKRRAKKFVKRIKNDDPEHSEKLKQILLNDYSLDESAATSAVENLLQQEHLLYSKIIELYLGNKETNLDDINDDVKNLTKVLHSVTINSSPNVEQISESASDTEDSSKEIKKLQNELIQVKKEKGRYTKRIKRCHGYYGRNDDRICINVCWWWKFR